MNYKLQVNILRVFVYVLVNFKIACTSLFVSSVIEFDQIE